MTCRVQVRMWWQAYLCLYRILFVYLVESFTDFVEILAQPALRKSVQAVCKKHKITYNGQVSYITPHIQGIGTTYTS